MSAIPLRQEAPRQTILKVYNAPYTLDPYHDRLESQGYNVLDGGTYEEALRLAHEQRPALIMVYDDPESGSTLCAGWSCSTTTASVGWP